mmetsp:Transcript_10603/g.21158  ORF Transcript_10603/g.21158 Transcript_10603/m.21158 type:complete len:257 (+) Transcript_10603:1253-2023(+)
MVLPRSGSPLPRKTHPAHLPQTRPAGGGRARKHAPPRPHRPPDGLLDRHRPQPRRLRRQAAVHHRPHVPRRPAPRSGHGPRVDVHGRIRAVRGGTGDTPHGGPRGEAAGRGQTGDHGTAEGRDAGIGTDRAHGGAVVSAPVPAGELVLRRPRSARARAGRGHAEGRPERGGHVGHGHAGAGAGSARAVGSGHDGGGKSERAGVAGGGYQRKSDGGAPGGDSMYHFSGTEQEGLRGAAGLLKGGTGGALCAGLQDRL